MEIPAAAKKCVSFEACVYITFPHNPEIPVWNFRIFSGNSQVASGGGYSGEEGEKHVWEAVTARIKDLFSK